MSSTIINFAGGTGSLCLRNGGVGRQHGATANPRAYVLSRDVAGPLRKKGRSPEGREYKYFLLGAYRYPRMVTEMEDGYQIPDEDPGEQPRLPPPGQPPGDDHDGHEGVDELDGFEKFGYGRADQTPSLAEGLVDIWNPGYLASGLRLKVVLPV